MVNMWVFVMMLVSAVCVNADEEFERVPCTDQLDNDRYAIVEQNQCGLMPTLVYFSPTPKYYDVWPNAVTVNRCSGTCSELYGCSALQRHVVEVPVRLIDHRNNTESCAYFNVEEHTLCGCCNLSDRECEGEIEPGANPSCDFTFTPSRVDYTCVCKDADRSNCNYQRKTWIENVCDCV